MNENARELLHALMSFIFDDRLSKINDPLFRYSRKSPIEIADKLIVKITPKAGVKFIRLLDALVQCGYGIKTDKHTYEFAEYHGKYCREGDSFIVNMNTPQGVDITDEEVK